MNHQNTFWGPRRHEVTRVSVLLEWGLELERMDDLKAHQYRMIARVEGKSKLKATRLEGRPESKVGKSQK